MNNQSFHARRALFWTSIVAGGICLLLVGGYYGGKKVYGTIEGMDRPGFAIWSRFYLRAIFMESDTKGYRYADLKRKYTMKVRLASCEYPSVSGDYAVCVFIKPDGSSLETTLFETDHQVDLEVGRHYQIEMWPIFMPDHESMGLHGAPPDPVEWGVWEAVSSIHALEEITHDD